jgi:hypothetical protein
VSRPRLPPLLAATALGLVACAGDARPTIPTTDPPPGTQLVLAASTELVFEAGGTSPEPIRVRATADGTPLPDVRVTFALDAALGRLSQTNAPTDADGWAEAWILDARPGLGSVQATLGVATVERAVRILGAPASVEIAIGDTVIGRPGFPPTDSLVRARVLDTEGAPMAGQPVFFAWAGDETVGIDTTDADGWAVGVLGASPIRAGEWPVFALLPSRPIVDVDVRITRPVARRIVLVAIDGLPADALDPAVHPGLMPTLTSLAEGGAVAPRVRSVEPTLSVPANLSMLAGEGPPSHQLYSEELEFTPEMNRLDPLFRIGLRQGRSTAAVLAGNGHLARFDDILECRLAFGFDRVTVVPGGASAVVDSVLPLLAEDGSEMLFVHLSDPDVAGHASGWGSDVWKAAVTEADRHLARIAGALPPDALLAVVAAHGGGGAFGTFQHGSTAPADLEVPLVLFGAGVEPGSLLSDVDLLDLAPTLAWSLGWAPAEGWDGAILLDGFGGTRPQQSGPMTP